MIGLHTMFEHHEVMTAEALKEFVREYRYILVTKLIVEAASR